MKLNLIAIRSVFLNWLCIDILTEDIHFKLCRASTLVFTYTEVHWTGSHDNVYKYIAFAFWKRFLKVIFEGVMHFLISSSHTEWGNWNVKMNRITVLILPYSGIEYNYITQFDLVLLMTCLFLNVIHWSNCFGFICQIYGIYPHPGNLALCWPNRLLRLLRSIILHYLSYLQGDIAAVVWETHCSEREKLHLILMHAVRERSHSTIKYEIEEQIASMAGFLASGSS